MRFILLPVFAGILMATLVMEIAEGRSILGCYARGLFHIESGHCTP